MNEKATGEIIFNRNLMDYETTSSITKTDACFSTAPASGYQLVVGLNGNSIQLLVFDPDKNRFIAFSQKDIQFTSGYQSYFEQIKNHLSENQLAGHQYKDVIVLWETQRSTLIPNALFEPAESETYFRFNHGAGTNEKILTDKLNTAEAYNVFAIPEGLEENLNFTSFRIRHHASVFIESMMVFSKHNMLPKQIFIHVHATFFDMLVTENGRLLFYNSFAYKTAEDFIYFVLFVYEQLKLSPEHNGIILSGGILKNSGLFDILYKYVRNVDFAIPNEQFAGSYILKDIPGHTIQNLAGSVLCEL